MTLSVCVKLNLYLDVVLKKLLNLNTNIGGGSNGIDFIVLKNCAGSLGVLCIFFLYIFAPRSFFLTQWKNFSITPILKTGRGQMASTNTDE